MLERGLSHAGPLRWYRCIAILVGIGTVVLLTLPGTAVAALGDLLAALIPWHDASDTGESSNDKLVHAALFGAWAFSLRRGWPSTSPLWLIAGLSSFAVLTEVLQTQIPGRTADLADGIADLGGAALGLALGGLTLLRQNRALSRPG